jgi:hypothetical protein
MMRENELVSMSTLASSVSMTVRSSYVTACEEAIITETRGFEGAEKNMRNGVDF